MNNVWALHWVTFLPNRWVLKKFNKQTLKEKESLISGFVLYLIDLKFQMFCFDDMLQD